MAAEIVSSPHVARPNRVDRLMLQTLLALVPGILAMTWAFGWGVPVQIALAVLCGLGAEAAVLLARARPVAPALRDGSAAVTAVLFALAIPPTLPWWLTLLGMVFAIVLVKQLYGGLGYNPFNPAMAAYVFLLVSYPVEMTRWLPPGGWGEHALSWPDALRPIFQGSLPPGLDWDAVSSATPLEALRHRSHAGIGPGSPWVGGAFLLGGLWLLWKRTIAWQIPLSMLTGLLALAGLFWLIDPLTYASPAVHLFGGAAILGAFFIATDPVTAATTPRGRLIYGAAIGALVFAIRTWGGYPDAVAFAVLLLNIAAPTIDHYTQPRVFGHRRRGDNG